MMPILAKRLFSFLLAAVFLSSCGGVTGISPTTTYSEPALTSQPTKIASTNTIPIENASENVEHIFDVELSRDKKLIALYTTSGIYVYDSTMHFHRPLRSRLMGKN